MCSGVCCIFQLISSNPNSRWPQTSRMLLIMSEMFQRYITLPGCHLTDVFWSLLLHLCSKKNLEFIETSCNNFVTLTAFHMKKKITSFHYLILKKNYLIPPSHTEKKITSFHHLILKKKSPHFIPLSFIPIPSQPSFLFALWLSVYQALAIGSGKRRKKKKKRSPQY